MSDIAPPRPIIGFEHGPDVRPLRALIELYAHTSPSLRGQFFTVLGLMLLNTLAELATIGAVIPFLALLADPGSLSNYRWIAGIFAAFGLEDDRQRLILAAASFGCFACIAGIMRLLLNRKTYAFTFDLLHALQRRVFGRLLIQPYEFHIQNGTPTLIAAVDKFEVIIFEVLLPIMLALSAALIATAIVAALVFIDPVMTVIAAACLSVIYIGISALAQPPLARNSRIIANGYDERLKIMQDGFGGIRDVIIDGNHALYDRLYDQSNGSLSEARASTAFIASAPRHAVETLGILLLIGLAMFSVDRAGGLAAALPALGALALGAQRLLPLTQQIYSSWSTVSGNRSVLSQTVRAMRLPERQTDLEAHHAIAPETGIVLNGVTFRYPSRNTPAIENVGLTISAGSSVALIGKTGSGKSTLADLIMGLLTPSAGQIEIDGVALDERRRRNWQNSIAHVPQSVFLADTTIARNIALSGGDRPLDHERLAGASRQAQLDEFIALLPDGLETVIGERGIRLSGGQRQRLGIARALYKDTPILVLDEATSALDEETEARVMKALAEPGQSRRTTIVIAHRLSTIAHCHTIVRLKGGRIEQIGDPAEVLGKGVSR